MSRSETGDANAAATSDHTLLIGLGRAAAGALLFTLPILMTMETWWLGFSVEPLRLALLLVMTLPLLVGLSRIGGFRRTSSILQDGADACIAIAIAALAATGLLWVFGVLSPEMPLSEIIGKIAVQITPGAIGAMLARSQLGSSGNDAKRYQMEDSYPGELFVMVAGALFLSLNIAPTEEVLLIGYQMSIWQQLGLLVLTLALMHGFVYELDFSGSASVTRTGGFWSLFLRFTIAGYVLVALVSLYVLWTFGRLDGTSAINIVSMVVVLSFPGAIGAAAARIIL